MSEPGDPGHVRTSERDRFRARLAGRPLVADGARVLAIFPWLVIFPGLALTATLLAFNLLGDGLRDALDPRDRRAAG